MDPQDRLRSRMWAVLMLAGLMVVVIVLVAR
jgi:hypothetical protein